MIHISIVPPLDCDVVVAGAGPAGAAAAAHLAATGRSTILIDRHTFPRDKVCGDFVGPAALVELSRLGITGFPEYRMSNVIRQAALFLDGKLLIRQPIPEVEGLPTYGRVIPRMQLDHWLVEAAVSVGARLIQQARVAGYAADDDGVNVTVEGPDSVRELRAKLLIAADGSGSQIARQVRGGAPSAGDRIIAVRAYFENIVGDSDQADLYFTGASFPGYYWLFPTGNTTANVGVGMVLETLPPTGDHLRDLLLRLIEDDPALRRRLAGATIRGKIVGWPLTTYNPGIPIVDERVILIGDAAGLINPLNGEGIQYALLSGRWASETALSCLREDRWELADLLPYVEKVEQELRYDMALSGLIVQFIRNRTLNPLWLEALRIIVSRARRDAAYAKICGGILAGLVPASEAISVRIIAGTLEQAALSFGWKALSAVLKGPIQIQQAADLGLTMTRETLMNPAAFLNWSAGVAVGLTELTGQMMKQFAEGQRTPIEVHRSEPAPQPLRLIIGASG